MPKPPPPHSPLAGYVALVTHLQSPRSPAEIETLISQELEGKRRDVLLQALVARLFVLKKHAYLGSIGVPSHGKRILA
jgi:hypothetical protein